MTCTPLALRALALTVLATVVGAPMASAQVRRVHGTVRAQDGTPVDGAEVRLAEALRGVLTHRTGAYELEVPTHAGAVEVRVRAAGYRPARRRVDARAGGDPVDVELVSDPSRLDDLVTAGVLAPTERSYVPFAVVRIDVPELPVPQDPAQLLAGRVPAATAMPVGGRPSAPIRVVLRSRRGLIPRSEPLILVDGVIMENGTQGLDVSDVARIEVLSGVAAAAFYGARAGGGVIHIATRRGPRGEGGATMRASTDVAASDVERVVPPARNTMLLMDDRNQRFCVVSPGPPCSATIDWRAEVARVNNEAGAPGAPVAFLVTPANASASALANLYQARPWPGSLHHPVAEMLRTGVSNRSHVDASIRGAGGRVSASVSRLSEPGVTRLLDGYERYAGRMNGDVALGSAWTVSVRTFASTGREEGRIHQDRLLAALTRQPAIADVFARDTLGRRFVVTDLRTSTVLDNPVAEVDNLSDDARSERYAAGVGLRYAPADWVDVAASVDMDRVDFRRTVRGSGFRGPFPPTSLSRQWAWSRGVAVAVDVTARRRVSRDVVATSGLRLSGNESDESSRWRQGGDTAFAERGVRLGSSDRGATLGTRLEYRDRYVLDAAVRREGLGDPAARVWKTSGRIAAAWRAARERWWFTPRTVTDLSVRVAWGSSAHVPGVRRLYELDAAPSLVIGTPARATETEMGLDLEVLGRFAVSATHARSSGSEPLAMVTPPGLGGVLTNVANVNVRHRAWEFMLDVPLIERSNASWTWRFGVERIRSTIGRLNRPPFVYGPTGLLFGGFVAAEGEPLAAMYGTRFVGSCADLPPAFAAQCGEGRPFQRNDEGFMVWVGSDASGAAFTWRDGIRRNLWGTRLQGSQAPWGVPLAWGSPIVIRDTTCVLAPSPACPTRQVRLGTGLPDAQVSLSTTARWHRLTVTGLVQGAFGREVWNLGRQLMYFGMQSAEMDQHWRSVESAKPIGYYQDLRGLTAANSAFVESASYAKVRELSVSYTLGPVLGLGHWSVTFAGRNLATLTNYRGFDPEVATAVDGQVPMAINATDGFAPPNLRTVVLSLAVQF